LPSIAPGRDRLKPPRRTTAGRPDGPRPPPEARSGVAPVPDGINLTVAPGEFVTHNVREAVRLAQRVVLLSSRPGRVAEEWRIDLPQPRRIESAGVADPSIEITEELRGEIRRHVQH
ncbi:hypothetical protein ACFV6F_38975, partial [Kitasatospora phosalacinea]